MQQAGGVCFELHSSGLGQPAGGESCERVALFWQGDGVPKRWFDASNRYGPDAGPYQAVRWLISLRVTHCSPCSFPASVLLRDLDARMSGVPPVLFDHVAQLPTVALDVAVTCMFVVSNPAHFRSSLAEKCTLHD